MSNPINHRFVPQVYFKGFDVGLGIIVYDTDDRGPNTADRRFAAAKQLDTEIDY